jgi:glutathione peroxidase-family protein
LAGKNFPGLQSLYDKYEPRGFVVLVSMFSLSLRAATARVCLERLNVAVFACKAFPCSQFLGQEPLSAEEIPKFMASKGVTYPVFGLTEVNGFNTDPLFAWLKEAAPGYLMNTVKWNFTKFLVVNGVPVKRYAPNDEFADIERDVVAALEDVKKKNAEL